MSTVACVWLQLCTHSLPACLPACLLACLLWQHTYLRTYATCMYVYLPTTVQCCSCMGKNKINFWTLRQKLEYNTMNVVTVSDDRQTGF